MHEAGDALLSGELEFVGRKALFASAYFTYIQSLNSKRQSTFQRALMEILPTVTDTTDQALKKIESNHRYISFLETKLAISTTLRHPKLLAIWPCDQQLSPSLALTNVPLRCNVELGLAHLLLTETGIAQKL